MNLLLPEKLKSGDTIGVIAPDKALKSTEKIILENATKYFESLGLNVKYGKYLFSDTEYCAGTPKQRAEDLDNMFCDKEVKAIFTVKGGKMANGILPFVDFEVIKNNPKIFLGMSDITVLLCSIHKMTGLVTFHSQDYLWFGIEEKSDYDKKELIDKLFQGNKIITQYDEREFFNFGDEIIKGKLYGTNAECLLKLVGTPYMPDLKDAVVFLEGYRPNIVQWNSMLEQYNQMGAFSKAVVFGYIYQLQQEERQDIVQELRKINQSIPVVKTNDFGHVHSNSILPIGVEVCIDPKEKRITVENYLK